MRTLVALLVCMLTFQVCAAEITNDHGGVIEVYVSRFHRMSTAEVTGLCASACTVLLGIVKNRCATRSAVFGFHSSVFIDGGYSEHGTRILWSYYSRAVREVLARHGWWRPSNHPSLVVVGWPEFLSFIAECER